jgi:RNA polymerase sigma factor (sigma-70 family)
MIGVGSSAPQVADSEKPKSPERIAPSPETKSSETAAPPAVDPAVAQRAVLYEENPGGGQQFQNFVGTAVWKTETVTLGAGRAPDLGLRIDVEIPDRHMSAVIKLRRNVDPSFPASHTIEVQFSTPNDPFGGVTDMRGMRAKSTETAQGTPLAAVVQKVKEGYFLLALPNIEEDSNLNMLRDRDWLDVLNDRERRIFQARRLSDNPITLEELASEFGVSRERVRQIEVRAFEKVQEAVVARMRAVETPAALPAH